MPFDDGGFQHTRGGEKATVVDHPSSLFFYQLSHQLNHLARFFSAGITVAEQIGN
jgi:hypothetical protein